MICLCLLVVPVYVSDPILGYLVFLFFFIAPSLHTLSSSLSLVLAAWPWPLPPAIIAAARPGTYYTSSAFLPPRRGSQHDVYVFSIESVRSRLIVTKNNSVPHILSTMFLIIKKSFSLIFFVITVNSKIMGRLERCDNVLCVKVTCDGWRGGQAGHIPPSPPPPWLPRGPFRCSQCVTLSKLPKFSSKA